MKLVSQYPVIVCATGLTWLMAYIPNDGGPSISPGEIESIVVKAGSQYENIGDLHKG